MIRPSVSVQSTIFFKTKGGGKIPTALHWIDSYRMNSDFFKHKHSCQSHWTRPKDNYVANRLAPQLLNRIVCSRSGTRGKSTVFKGNILSEFKTGIFWKLQNIGICSGIRLGHPFPSWAEDSFSLITILAVTTT